MDDSIYEEEEKNFRRLRLYLSYCKRFFPVLSHEAKNMLIQYYANIATTTGSPRVFDSLKNIAFGITRLKQKDTIEAEDAAEAKEFYNVMYLQLEEIVIVARDPRELAISEIISILSVNSNGYRCEFTELVRQVCKVNEFVARYIGDDFSVSTNRKLRALREKFIAGVDNRVVVVSISPLVLEWMTKAEAEGPGVKDQTQGHAQAQSDVNDVNDVNVTRK